VGSFFEQMTQQLEEKDAELVPTQEQHAQKSWLVGTLKPLLERHTGGVFHTFGSCENGFWMKGSDVDACLVIGRCTSRQSWLTKLRLVQCLVKRERIGTAQVVKARVPVAKLSDQEGAELCDVSVNNVAALENSRFVAALSQLDPRVPRLGRFIKHWASMRQINNRSEGTLSTYTLILQLFFFLQTRQPPLLPRVVEMLAYDEMAAALQRPAGAAPGTGSPPGAETRAVNALISCPEMDAASGALRPLPFLTDPAAIRREGGLPEAGRNEESLGELLHGFFQLWGQEAFRGGDEGSGQSVLVYDGTREVNDLGVLVMRCPLTGKNVNPFTTLVWRAIHAEFERAASLLARGRPLAELCEAAEESPAGRGPRRA